MKKVIVASQNKGKIKEVCDILYKFGIEAVSRDDAGIPKFEIEETGETFEENSYIKAKAIFDITKEMVIADDSGLMVEALDGAPGVYSARFSGDAATYESNNKKLLKLMQGVKNRSAKFVSVITMIFDDETKIVARGEVKGSIAEKPSGGAGFGYDPIFVPNGYDITFAEMDKEQKNKISHRRRALEALEEKISEKD